MKQVSIVTVDPGDGLVLLAQAGILRVVIAWSLGRWLFAGATTCENCHSPSFTRIAGLSGMCPVAQDPTTHKEGLEPGTLVSHTSVLNLPTNP